MGGTTEEVVVLPPCYSHVLSRQSGRYLTPYSTMYSTEEVIGWETSLRWFETQNGSLIFPKRKVKYQAGLGPGPGLSFPSFPSFPPPQ